ncbi:MAG: hypothetical protein ABFS35_20815 [Bacteroidota bacterium]
MKKVLIGFLSLIFAGQVAVAQPVSDQAIIPMAITINSILRLNIVSGGNMEFVFNSIDQITNGIVNSTAYDTRFTVASSTNWTLNFGTDVADFTATGGAIIPLNLVALQVDNDVTGTCFPGRCVSATYFGAYGDLVNATTALINNGTGNVGNSVDNAFVIHWECATAANCTSQFLPTGAVAAGPGRYSANIFLSLVAL